VKILVVGLGSMGKRRIRLLMRFEQVEKIIGIDSRDDRRYEVEKLYECDTYSSIDEALMKENNVSCAFICTAPMSHSILIKKALDCNLNVFTEINLIADGYIENVELAKAKNKILFLSSTFLYREEIQYLQKCIGNKNRLNYVYHVGQYLPDWHPWENYNDFFVGSKETNGCRELLAIELPWILRIFGKIKKYNVVADNISELNIDYKDNFIIQFEHDNGNKGVIIIDIVSPKGVRNLEIYGENVYYSWNGSPDTLEEFEPTERKVRKVKLLEEAEHIDGYSSFIVENAYQNEIQEFMDAIEGKCKLKYGFMEDIEVLKLIDSIESDN